MTVKPDPKKDKRKATLKMVVNTKLQGQTANTKQNITHQGRQEDR